MKTAIVIGAGIGGLASAIRLAVKNYKVQLFEANSYPGGKLCQIQKNCFRFDAGPSLFTMPEKVEDLFTLAGKKTDPYFTYRQLNTICRYFYEDGMELTATAQIETFAAEVEKKMGIPKLKILRYLAQSQYLYRHTGHLFLEQSLHRWQTYASWKTLRSILHLPFLNIFTTMHRANQTAFEDEKLVQFFDRYATYNGSNPYQAPATLNVIPHLEFGKGAFFQKEECIKLRKVFSNWLRT